MPGKRATEKGDFVMPRMSYRDNITVPDSSVTDSAIPVINTSLPPNAGVGLGQSDTNQYGRNAQFDLAVLLEGGSGPVPSSSSSGAAVEVFDTGSGGFTGICLANQYFWAATPGGQLVKCLKTDASVVASYSVAADSRSLYFDGTNIWAPFFSGSNLLRILESTGAVLDTYVIGGLPGGICFDGVNVWAVSSSLNALVKVRAVDGVLLATYNVGDYPTSTCFDGTDIWVVANGDGTIEKRSAATGALLDTYTFVTNPTYICFDGTYIWATTDNGYVMKMTTGGVTVGTYLVGDASSDLMAIMYVGGSVWVNDSANAVITQLSASTGASQNVYAVNPSPYNICSDGMFVWVAHYASPDITRIRISAPAGGGSARLEIWLKAEVEALMLRTAAELSSSSSSSRPLPVTEDWVYVAGKTFKRSELWVVENIPPGKYKVVVTALTGAVTIRDQHAV